MYVYNYVPTGPWNKADESIVKSINPVSTIYESSTFLINQKQATNQTNNLWS